MKRIEKDLTKYNKNILQSKNITRKLKIHSTYVACFERKHKYKTLNFKIISNLIINWLKDVNMRIL